MDRIAIPTPTGSDAKATKRSRSEDLVGLDKMNLTDRPDETIAIAGSPTKKRRDTSDRGASQTTQNITSPTTRRPETPNPPFVNTFSSSVSSDAL